MNARTNDSEFLERLSNTYREAVRRYFLKRVGNIDEAEDLTQELFLRIVRRGQSDDIMDAESFLFQSASNLLRDRQRRRRTSYRFLNDWGHFREENIETLSPERVLDGKQSLRAALAALGRLDQRTRNAFLLHRLLGLKYVEIAHVYGVSVSSVEKYMLRASAAMARYTAKRRN